MVELQGNELVFRFPEVHEQAICRINFQRTLRIPDDNRSYPLPPGLGSFPMVHVDDHAERLPEAWRRHGGTLLPMYQAEALWIHFRADTGYPFAIKIAAGKINAVTGETWADALTEDPQDYIVTPGQPWLDGFGVGEGMIRQFVAMPLGQGYTAEEQLTGAAEHGGLQCIAYPMKASVYEAMLASRARFTDRVEECAVDMCVSGSIQEMGLAPGGLMEQEIYDDEHGIDAWDQDQASRCFVHLLNSAQWQQVTGQPVPTEPPTARQYTAAGLPWFDYYDEGRKALPGAGSLAGLDSVAAKGIKQGEQPLPENAPVQGEKVVKLGPGAAAVSDGQW